MWSGYSVKSKVDLLLVIPLNIGLNYKIIMKGDVFMTAKKSFSTEEAASIGGKLGLDWSKFDVEQFRMGMDVELEHGLIDPETNLTDDDPLKTGKIALAHLNEFPDYYTRLEKMEKEADQYWGK